MDYKILTYKEIDRTEWSALVNASATGTWFQSPEAYDFFTSQKDIMEPFVVGVEASPQPSPKGKGVEQPLNPPHDSFASVWGVHTADSTQYDLLKANAEAIQGRTEDRHVLRGVCCGYVTVEKNAVKQFLTRRAIIIGGPCFADDCTDEEVQTLMEAVREQPILNPFLIERTSNRSSLQGRVGKRLLSPIYIETRNFNSYAQWKEAFEKAGFSYQPHLNFHVDSSDEDAMWERLSENRKRQIRKGERLSAIADEVREEDIREWYAILKQLYRTKVKTPLWPVEFFLEAYRNGVGKFLLVKHEGKVIGGSMVVTDAKCVYEWFECGLNAEYKEQYPSVMATWAGMHYAHETGCARYDMMGAGAPGVPYGVRDFKSEFGGELVEHGRFLCICKPWLYKIGKLGVNLLKKI